ncbi:HlyD family efflux transporter periplasmic adaptor subunit [Trinickia caryophylli]|uniref:HlyD family secretion protein n=1 Tax=Trinickia caryophylli TaxID=28094 RepID=A0A1X7DIA8_TRICW|nr:HlyD family efflux transporter periplasmic adaptor subunit [Trinickia caryophylli]PMS12295.1 hemolysin D [Trinickia caryophylli]TRX17032.1 HlyD family efflux transporter periplasmic adaptor subunit [Trinickia caryophylli]WQE12230.1 HlyD family efflux transporter periplasmic adaptor subunit [Trinickia caryophylli]SMF15951.1 HlyD family secretion protein [Trinickia caryophylli]GLU31630.1 hemolysin D [Trinickia caryophylli]
MSPHIKKWLPALAVAALAAALGYFAYVRLHDTGPGTAFASGNGRIEATEIDVATKLAGRIEHIDVDEGDYVKAGQRVAQMQVQVLEAQLAEAKAQQARTVSSAASVDAQVAQRRSDKVAAEAVVAERESQLDAAMRKLARSETLSREGASSMQELDDDRARVRSARAAVASAKAQVGAAQAAIDATSAQLVAARSGIEAAQATVARVEADIDDSQLTAPRDGRVQYRVAEPGEVLGAGGKVLNLVDLSDVYMTFFLPETTVGKVALGAQARIVLDAAPEYVIPATISFVSATAQFTPKTVETAAERQKLMFRVKAKISRELLLKHLKLVKTGLPGVAWVQLDPNATWPATLSIKLPR